MVSVPFSQSIITGTQFVFVNEIGNKATRLGVVILVSKFLLHQPLNRQAATYAREEVEIDTSTLGPRTNCQCRINDQLKLEEVV